MAVDDVISDWEVSISSGGRTALQPGSGVEWLITELLSDELTNSEAVIFPTVTSDYYKTQPPNVSSFVPNASMINMFVNPAYWTVTNGQYPRMANEGSATEIWIYSGIQTK